MKPRSAHPPDRRGLGIGLVGTGFLAAARARTWRRVGELPAEIRSVVGSRPGGARAFAQRHGIPQADDRLDELLARPAIDVVDLCVPNHLHRPLTEAAVAAGKHVICTKPLAAYVGQDLPPEDGDEAVGERDPEHMRRVACADAKAMIDAAAAAGVRLFYAENWLFAPSILRARELLAAAGGRVLEMRGWESHSGSHSPYAKSWRYAGGGALLRLGSHPLGAMLAIKREEGLARDGRPIRAVSVSADTADLSRVAGLEHGRSFVATGWKDVETWASCIIAFEDGSRGVALASDAMLGGMQSRLVVLASSCHLDCRLSPQDSLLAYAPAPEVFGDQYLMEKLDARAGWSPVMPDEDATSGAVGMCTAFARAITRDEPCLADGELGAEVVRVLYSAYVSARAGRRVALDRAEAP